MSKRSKKNNLTKFIIALILLIIIGIIGYINPEFQEFILGDLNEQNNTTSVQSELSYTTSFDLNSIPEFLDVPYVVLNDNKPNFDESDLTTDSFEKYSELDSFGRCGIAFANISLDTMPDEDEERESFSETEGRLPGSGYPRQEL